MSAVISLSEVRRRKETAKEAEIASNWMWVLMLPLSDRYIEVGEDSYWLYVGDNSDSNNRDLIWTRHSELSGDEFLWLINRGVGFFFPSDEDEMRVNYNIEWFNFSRV
ncbi:TPA: hypothetical protein ACM5MF_004354 [Escherichia coli]